MTLIGLARTNVMRYVINLYFGFERVWCWFNADSEDSARQFANEWAEQYIVRPDVITVYACPKP